ncbi:hypothetical protein A8H27_12560 [Burkholderia cenocepacia]|nr:hypothetical protein A8H27_12560 [Burkholderia cenocepacia]
MQRGALPLTIALEDARPLTFDLQNSNVNVIAKLSFLDDMGRPLVISIDVQHRERLVLVTLDDVSRSQQHTARADVKRCPQKSGAAKTVRLTDYRDYRYDVVSDHATLMRMTHVHAVVLR